jgi:hypothetical protein
MNKKQFIKFKLLKDSLHYFPEEYGTNVQTLDYLGDLLLDIRNTKDCDHWITWIQNLTEDQTIGGNIIYLRKYGEIITLYNELFDKKYFFNISKKNLLEILDQWEQLRKEKPQEIWIFEENGKVWLEGKN